MKCSRRSKPAYCKRCLPAFAASRHRRPRLTGTGAIYKENICASRHGGNFRHGFSFSAPLRLTKTWTTHDCLTLTSNIHTPTKARNAQPLPQNRHA